MVATDHLGLVDHLSLPSPTSQLVASTELGTEATSAVPPAPPLKNTCHNAGLEKPMTPTDDDSMARSGGITDDTVLGEGSLSQYPHLSSYENLFTLVFSLLP
jgi:hypothetical protein